MFCAQPRTGTCKFINAYKSASSRTVEKGISRNQEKTLERSLLESEMLPADRRTFQDISQTLNISENTVKSRFYKMIRANKKRGGLSVMKKENNQEFYVEQMDGGTPVEVIRQYIET